MQTIVQPIKFVWLIPRIKPVFNASSNHNRKSSEIDSNPFFNLMF